MTKHYMHFGSFIREYDLQAKTFRDIPMTVPKWITDDIKPSTKLWVFDKVKIRNGLVIPDK